jgi:hypothetical protein
LTLNFRAAFRTVILTINGAFGSGTRRAVIVPTAEADPAEQSAIHQYAHGIQEQFAKDGEFLTDEQALSRDLSGFGLRVYGTLTGNKGLGRHKDRIPAIPILENSKEARPRRRERHQRRFCRPYRLDPGPRNRCPGHRRLPETRWGLGAQIAVRHAPWPPCQKCN